MRTNHASATLANCEFEVSRLRKGLSTIHYTMVCSIIFQLYLMCVPDKF